MIHDPINVQIAEYCGWKVFDEPVLIYGEVCLAKTPQGDYTHTTLKYTECLNAMHEAEKVIYPYRQLWNAYYNAVGMGPFSLHATASKKAEAFLKAIGKGKKVSNE